MLFCKAGLNTHDHEAVISWCKTTDISLVVVGPEDLLAEGLCDALLNAGKYFLIEYSLS